MSKDVLEANKWIDKLKCLFGFHNWINLDNSQPEIPKGGCVHVSDLHECSRCKKQEYKGMGIYM